MLGNMALTAPHMHEGSLSTLRDVEKYYPRGGHRPNSMDPMIRPLDLGDRELADLVAFLESLTGEGLGELIDDARTETTGNPG